MRALTISGQIQKEVHAFEQRKQKNLSRRSLHFNEDNSLYEDQSNYKPENQPKKPKKDI